jgi:phage recombination protein Bet
MSNLAALPSAAGFTPAQLKLIRQTVAGDTNEMEFDLFIAAARNSGLDPFRKQISAIVFNKNNPDKRKMSIITTIDGFRVIAERTRLYRPDDEPPRYEIDPALKSAANPIGIVSCTVKVYKRDQDGVWFACAGQAYWDEFASVKEEWAEDETGKRRRTGKSAADGNWGRMARVMIAKCAEAQALRRAFPDAFSGIYEASELDRAMMEDATPSEALVNYETQERIAKLGGPSILFQLEPSAPLEAIPLGRVADRVQEQLSLMVDRRQVDSFSRTNKDALKQFWGHSKGDALELKKAIDQRLDELPE